MYQKEYKIHTDVIHNVLGNMVYTISHSKEIMQNGSRIEI